MDFLGFLMLLGRLAQDQSVAQQGVDRLIGRHGDLQRLLLAVLLGSRPLPPIQSIYRS